MERNIEIFSLLPAIKNSRQFLLLGTDILQKTVNGYLQGSLDQSLTDRCKHFSNLAFSMVNTLQTNLSQTLLRRTNFRKKKPAEKGQKL